VIRIIRIIKNKNPLKESPWRMSVFLSHRRVRLCSFELRRDKRENYGTFL